MSVFVKKPVRVLVAALLATVVGLGVVHAYNITGPNSRQTPYVVRAVPGVVTRSILTVGDSVGGYRLVGIPDGLGAFDNGNGTFTLLMNHELGSSVGAVRAHGAAGAFVSKWIIRKGSLNVQHGEDLIHQVATWNTATNQYNPPAQGIVMGRFCSADLPPISAFYDAASGLGYNGRIYMNGEEVGAEGRAFAHLLNGTSYELPRLGKYSWENSVANPATGTRTVVVGLDDSGGGQVYVYAGNKTNSGLAVDKAGLTNGNLYGIQVQGLLTETNATTLPDPTPFTVYNLGNVANMTGAQLQSLSTANAVTAFQRPEDGAWDPSHPNDFYFVTTASFTGNSRLWRLRFTDATNPAAGGMVEMLLDGTEGQRMMDNITVTDRGQVFIQEDIGNQSPLGRIWRYSIAFDALHLIAEHDPDRFTPGAPHFLTQDEESSGIIDVSHILGEGWFLLDVQAHYDIGDPELVEGGQLLALHVPPGQRR